jgi:hypothetical protein
MSMLQVEAIVAFWVIRNILELTTPPCDARNEADGKCLESLHIGWLHCPIHQAMHGRRIERHIFRDNVYDSSVHGSSESRHEETISEQVGLYSDLRVFTSCCGTSAHDAIPFVVLLPIWNLLGISPLHEDIDLRDYHSVHYITIKPC